MYVVILTIAILLCLIGCTKDNKEIITVHGVEQAKNTPVPIQVPTPSPSPAFEPKELSLGVVSAEKYKYTNEYFGLEFNAGSGWVFVKRADLAKAMKINLNQYEADVRSLLASYESVFDVIASTEDENRAFNVIFQRNTEESDELSLDDSLEKTASEMSATLGSAGYTDVSCSVSTSNVSGIDYPSIITTARISERTYFCRQIFIIKNEYIAAVTASCYDEDATKEILSMLSITK